MRRVLAMGLVAAASAALAGDDLRIRTAVGGRWRLEYAVRTRFTQADARASTSVESGEEWVARLTVERIESRDAKPSLAYMKLLFERFLLTQNVERRFRRLVRRADGKTVVDNEPATGRRFEYDMAEYKNADEKDVPREFRSLHRMLSEEQELRVDASGRVTFDSAAAMGRYIRILPPLPPNGNPDGDWSHTVEWATDAGRFVFHLRCSAEAAPGGWRLRRRLEKLEIKDAAPHLRIRVEEARFDGSYRLENGAPLLQGDTTILLRLRILCLLGPLEVRVETVLRSSVNVRLSKAPQ